MVVADITLTHSEVNSGTAVELQGTEVSVSGTNGLFSNPGVAKYDIVEVDVLGFGENTVFVVKGLFNVEDNPSNTVTQSLILDFKQVRTSITMAVSAGTTPQKLKGRPTAGYTIGGTYLDTIKVFLKSYRISFSSIKSQEGVIWNYQLTFVETA